ncbi:MAG: hypothetical protein AB7W16_21985 [Candidatus Obscuribacterales bacterium]
MRAIASFISVLAVAGFIAVCPASAQEFPAPAPSQPLAEPQITPEMRAQMKPGIRYTIGSKKTAGWQHNLVKSNKNLGNFFWAEMSSMQQASVSERTGPQAQHIARQRQEYHYIKPQHVANPINPACKLPPRHAVARRLPETNVNASLSHRRSDVSGQLISQQTGAKVYADYGNSNNTNARGYLSSKEAYGKLMND